VTEDVRWSSRAQVYEKSNIVVSFEAVLIFFALSGLREEKAFDREGREGGSAKDAKKSKIKIETGHCLEFFACRV
jgi:hypothetical protein